MPNLPRLFLSLLLILGSATVHAQSVGQAATPAASPAQTLDQLSSQLDTVKAALKKGGSAALPLADLRDTALAVQDQARQLTTSLAPQMTALQAQLAVLGTAPVKGVSTEAAEVAAQRRQLDKAQADLDAQIKQSQLLNQTAMQLAAQITGLRNDQFQARLASRTATPFSHTFWADPARTFPDDLVRLKRLGARFADSVSEACQPPNRQPLLWCLAAAALLLAGGRWALERLLLGLATRRVPDGHLRRSVMASAVALTAVLTTGLAAQLAYLGLNWNDILDDDVRALATDAVGLVCFAAFVTGLGRALLSVRRPSWRLPALSDLAAQRLRPYPWLLAAASLLFGMTERIMRTVGTSLPATVATRGLLALVISGPAEHAEPMHQPAWLSVLLVAATLGVAVSWLAVAAGYIALAFFIAVQMLWIGVITATVYLLNHLLTDLVETSLAPRGHSGQRLQATFNLAPHKLEQTSVLLGGLIRVAGTGHRTDSVRSRPGGSAGQCKTDAGQSEAR
jgi:potassium efflux system protein